VSKLRIVKGSEAGAGLSGAALFAVLWGALADLLGPAATAALLRRAVQRALPASEELRGLRIERIDAEFGYAVPASFQHTIGPPAALRALTDALRPLLEEQTGGVALRHLETVPELRRWVSASPLP
jgi:hypothetical protein